MLFAGTCQRMRQSSRLHRRGRLASTTCGRASIRCRPLDDPAALRGRPPRATRGIGGPGSLRGGRRFDGAKHRAAPEVLRVVAQRVDLRSDAAERAVQPRLQRQRPLRHLLLRGGAQSALIWQASIRWSGGSDMTWACAARDRALLRLRATALGTSGRPRCLDDRRRRRGGRVAAPQALPADSAGPQHLGAARARWACPPGPAREIHEASNQSVRPSR